MGVVSNDVSAAASTIPPVAGGKASGLKSLIYVVDDEPLVGKVVAMMLEVEGFQIEFFQNPSLAFQAFASAQPRPGLLLTDFFMESLNGMELIVQCKAVQPNLKTILYSGNAEPAVMGQYAVKPDFFIRKPFPPKVLIQAVQTLLAG